MPASPAAPSVPLAAPLLAGAESFSHDGGRVGALVLHGFTGCPQSVRPWAQRLAEEGLTVRLPLLPGHGTTVHDLAATRWDDWYAAARTAFEDVQSRCDAVFVMGLSMGGTLALRLAETRGEAVRGLVLVNASVASADRRLLVLPLLKYVVPSLPGIGNDIKRAGVTEVAYDRTPLRSLDSLRAAWRTVRGELGRIHCPVRHYRSQVDHVVDASSGEALRAGIPGLDEVVLSDSYHVATLDNDAQTIITGSLEFIHRHAGQG